MEGGDRAVTVDGGHCRAAAGAVLNEAAGEVSAAEERALGDEQGNSGFERVESGGAA